MEHNESQGVAEMMTAGEAARYLGVTPDAVYKARRQGRLASVTASVHRHFYKREELDRFSETIPPAEKRKRPKRNDEHEKRQHLYQW